MTNSDNSSKKEIFNTILKNTTLIFALIIFLSFFQIYIFFQNFNIGVYNYNSSYELLLYFIPSYIITPINIVLNILNIKIFSICDDINVNLYVIVFLFFVIDLKFLKKKCINKFLYFWNKIIEVKFVNGEYKYFNNWFHKGLIVYVVIVSYFIIELLYKLLSLSKFSDFEYYLINNFVNVNGGNHHTCFKILFFFWGFSVFICLYRYLKSKESFRFMRISLYTLILVILIMFIFSAIKTTYRVASLKNRKTLQIVDFDYEGKHIVTDSNNFYIGQTKDYLFIRNFEERENKVYNLNSIKNLIVKDIDSSFSK
jgi:hypothetical protein